MDYLDAFTIKSRHLSKVSTALGVKLKIFENLWKNLPDPYTFNLAMKMPYGKLLKALELSDRNAPSYLLWSKYDFHFSINVKRQSSNPHYVKILFSKCTNFLIPPSKIF